MEIIFGIAWVLVVIIGNGIKPFIIISGLVFGILSRRALYLIPCAMIIVAAFFLLTKWGYDLGYMAHNPNLKQTITPLHVFLYLIAAYIWTLIGYGLRAIFRNAIKGW